MCNHYSHYRCGCATALTILCCLLKLYVMLIFCPWIRSLLYWPPKKLKWVTQIILEKNILSFKMRLFKHSSFISLFLTHGEPQNIELALARKDCPEAKGNGCDSKFSVAICPPQFIQLYPACMQMAVWVWVGSKGELGPSKTNFYFGKILDLWKSCKNSTESSHIPLTQFPLMLALYIDTVTC